MLTGSLPGYNVGGEGEGEAEKGKEKRLSILIGCDGDLCLEDNAGWMPERCSAEERGELRGERDKSDAGCF